MNEDLQDIILNGLQGDFWNEYLKPEIEKDIGLMKEYLTTCSPESVAVVQAKIATLRYILEKPRLDAKAQKGENNGNG